MSQQLEFGFSYTQNKPVVIAFVGRRGSGKSTAADIVAEHYSNTVNLEFSQPLKKVAADWHQISLEELERQKEDVRTLLQDLGDLARGVLVEPINPLINCVDMGIKSSPHAKIITVSDARTKLEADYINSIGGRIILIESHPTVDKCNPVDDHWTETEVDEICPDCVVINHKGDQDSFKTEVLNAVEWAIENTQATPRPLDLSVN